MDILSMTLSYDPNRYRPSQFDDDMCLKPPLPLWLAVIYLARAVVLPIGIGVGHIAGVDDRAFGSLRSLWSAEALLPALLALPVLYALFRRAPSAGRTTRWFWRQGRIFLSLSAGLDVALSLFQLATSRLGGDPIVALGAASVDLYVLAYILMARRVRDVFSDFPPPHRAAPQ
jgi:hypothetical protein